MESAKSTENLTTRSGGNDNNKIQLVLLVIAVVVAIVALIVAFIALSQKGTTNLVMSPTDGGSSSAQNGQTGANYDDQKIWSIAIGHEDASSSYIDDVTGQLSGFYPDIVNAVCKVGNKNCRIIYDVWNHCWDSEAGQVARGGVGLMSSWYDACAGWYGTRDRYRTFTFTNAFSKAEEESLYVKKGSALATTWKDVTNRKVGILDGWWTSEFCLLLNKEQFDAGLPLTETQIIHYFGPPDLLEAVNNGEVDFAFIGIKTSISSELQRVDGNPVLPCSLQGPGVMVRQVDQPFLDWFNPALDQLMKSPEYNNVCQDLAQAHGHFPGLDPKESCFLD